jgi:hypothetical protein
LLYKMGLDRNSMRQYDEHGELRKRCHTPSPIKRIEDSLYINNLQSFDLSFNGPGLSEINSNFMSQQQDDLISLKSFNGHHSGASQPTSKCHSISSKLGFANSSLSRKNLVIPPPSLPQQ